MNHWSSEQWATLITAALGALGAFAVSVINALKGHADRQEIKERLTGVETAQLAHERAADRRSRLPLAARLSAPAPPAFLEGAVMAEEQPAPPGAFGIEHAFQRLTKHLDQFLKHQHQELLAAIGRLERNESSMATQLEDMDAKLDNIANTETQLGVDIQTVVDFLKANPNPTPTDLSAQLAKLDGIAQKLIDTDASTLANLPPTPEPPVPARRK